MKGRDKEDVVTILDLIFILTFQLPVCIVNKDQNAGSSGYIVSRIDVHL